MIVLRNSSIDIMKCVAAIAITNSHMGLLYGDYAVLATGGAIGDVLFFFCSGFTLFMGRGGRFDNWYKRRINRIYPTVFVWAVIAALVFGRKDPMDVVLLHGGGWFVSCIMLYYVVLYFIRRWMMGALLWIMSVFFVGCGVWLVLTDTPPDYNMYGETYFKWFHYFMFMLMGAIVGVKSQKKEMAAKSYDIALLMACVAAFYALCAFKLSAEWNKVQYLSIIPLAGVVYYAYRVCSSGWMTRLYKHRICGWIIKFVGGLCLEIYLVQMSLFTDEWNSLFPLNLLLMFAVVVCAAYLLRCCARAFSQTFKDMDYDWKVVVKPV